MKYTKEYLKENRVAIECESWQQAELICSYYRCENGYGGALKYLTFGLYGGGFSFRNRFVRPYVSVVHASEVIADYEASKRKIIGYKAPFDLFNSTVKKGELYIKKNKCNKGYDYEKTKDDHLSKTFYLPQEIVEQWEPVYEEEKPTFGSFSDIVIHFKNSIITLKGQIHIEQTIFHNVGTMTDVFWLTKDNYSFTPDFEKELTELGIKI